MKILTPNRKWGLAWFGWLALSDLIFWIPMSVIHPYFIIPWIFMGIFSGDAANKISEVKI
jgi:hypothetical protein